MKDKGRRDYTYDPWSHERGPVQSRGGDNGQISASVQPPDPAGASSREPSSAPRMPGARQARGRAPAKAKRAGRPVDERLGGRRGRPFACRQCGKRSAAFRWTKQFCSLRGRVAAPKIVGIDDPAFMRRVMEHVVALQAEQAKLTAGSP